MSQIVWWHAVVDGVHYRTYYDALERVRQRWYCFMNNAQNCSPKDACDDMCGWVHDERTPILELGKAW